ncbi:MULTISPECIES: phosphatase PAP2 family protein [Thermomonosporaceae]|uniref:phosphatase PAP2 family protein n=1 Tax=Thermomonosporaceae TaxID=2012 RepID=UPI00255AE691|nr:MULTISPECIES: phosphatase PAP2 family protein [Thermomonosporaceae]MDL4776891.1 phosphatase PAP2 family protein [Actinomadura xylanilytica]
MQAPEFSADWYRGITEFAHGTPSWVHSVAEVGTDAGLLLFAVLFVAGWWRARGGEARAMGLALAAPCAMVAAYLVSEVSKSFIQEERPCRAVAGAMNIAACPAPGDWSFPSNHATIAAGSAAAIVVAWRAMAPLVLPLAALMALSRVFVGVHYPHDVAAGFLVGVVVAPLVALVLVRLAVPVVTLVRGLPFGVILLGPSPAGAVAGAGMIPPGSARPGGARPGEVRPGASGAHAAPGAPDAGQAAQTMPDVMGGMGRHRRPHD